VYKKIVSIAFGFAAAFPAARSGRFLHQRRTWKRCNGARDDWAVGANRVREGTRFARINDRGRARCLPARKGN
jgi:hypothetical protein